MTSGNINDLGNRRQPATGNGQRSVPPKWAVHFFRWYCNDHLSEAALGDMIELYERRRKKIGRLKADLLFVWNVTQFIQPFAIKRSRSAPLNQFAMFENYFKIAWRSMSRQKMYSGIKIGGFAVGIATCLLIALFVRQELTYDRHYKNTDRLYRLVREGVFNGEKRKGVYFSSPMANALRSEFPEIELAGHYSSTEFFGAGSNEIRRTDQAESLHEEGFVFADQSLVDVLEMPFVQGNPRKALLEPNTIVITQSKANKYFPNEDAIGKVFMLNNDETRQYKVTGVIKDFPVTSHFQFDFLMSLAGREFWPGEKTDWGSGNYMNYVRIQPGTDVHQLEIKLHALITKYFLPSAVEGHANARELNWLKSLRFELQPVTDIYINSCQVGDSLSHGDIRSIWMFGAIALFILLIACVNFINLSTAKSADRAKEVGLRKVVGSRRANLVHQFLLESSLVSLVSFSLGLALARLLLPFFNVLMGKSLIFPWEWWLMPVLLTGTLLIGLLAGAYPSFYLSSFKPIQVIKGSMSLGIKSTFTRSALVVFQFTVSMVLIVGTLIINKQMDYVLTKKIGFDKEQVLLLEDAHTLGEKLPSFKNELLNLPQVKFVSISSYLPVANTKRNGNTFFTEGRKDNDQGAQAQIWSVDQDYIKTMGIHLLSGRDFISDRATDSQSMIINSMMARKLNLTDPIGKTIVNGGAGKWTVIGVVDDFHFESFKENIQPLCFVMEKSPDVVLIKMSSTDPQGTLQAVTAVWKQFSPNQAIRYSFLDQNYAKMYGDVQRMARVFGSFAGLAILVACLGLFALSAYIVEQRGKEISIRLVLGASVRSVVQLITRNFVRLVLISFLVAAPLSWILMNKWLEDYAYKTTVSWDVFLIAGVISLCVALLTVGYQSIRAAFANPAKTLRSE